MTALIGRSVPLGRSLAAEGGFVEPHMIETVIFITAKFRVLPEHADNWADITREFTEATRAEAGNMWFDWSRNLEDPTEYLLVEAFLDGAAGTAHVQSDHFTTAIAALPQYLVETPRIISQMIDQDDWSELSEMMVG